MYRFFSSFIFILRHRNRITVGDADMKVIEVEGARLVLNEVWEEALRLRAEADKVSPEELVKIIINIFEDYWKRRVYPDKIGVWPARYDEESGKFYMEGLEGEVEYTRQNLLETTFYIFLRPYILAVAMRRLNIDTKILVLREDEVLEIDKEGIKRINNENHDNNDIV